MLWCVWSLLTSILWHGDSVEKQKQRSIILRCCGRRMYDRYNCIKRFKWLLSYLAVCPLYVSLWRSFQSPSHRYVTIYSIRLITYVKWAHSCVISAFSWCIECFQLKPLRWEDRHHKCEKKDYRVHDFQDAIVSEMLYYDVRATDMTHNCWVNFN